MTDPETYRAESRQRWEAVAGGWEAHRDTMQASMQPVSDWMVAAIDPQPGQTVLELAAGAGATGFLAAQRLGSEGKLISTDGAEAMVEAGRRRSAELGLDNVEHRTMEAEWIDLPTASVDAVLCRWGYMLLADPEAALRETRRVLRPGGRLALAAWDAPEHNPWQATIGKVLVERGLAEPAEPGAPGMFAFAAPGRTEELLGAAGFDDIVVESLDFTINAPSFDQWWETQFDISPTMSTALAGLDPGELDALHEEVGTRYVPFTDEQGALRMPARALVASASG